MQPKIEVVLIMYMSLPIGDECQSKLFLSPASPTEDMMIFVIYKIAI